MNDEQIQKEIKSQHMGQNPMGAMMSGLIEGKELVPPHLRLELALGQLLDQTLRDLDGSLNAVLRTEFKQRALYLANQLDQPEKALIKILQDLLDQTPLLQELVQKCDRHWGLQYGEKPYFEGNGPAHPQDPYTFQSVKQSLLDVINALDLKTK